MSESASPTDIPGSGGGGGVAERPQTPAAARVRSPPHRGELRQVQRHPHTRGSRGLELPLRADFLQLLQQVSLSMI